MPIGGVASGRVCVWSLRIRLVFDVVFSSDCPGYDIVREMVSKLRDVSISYLDKFGGTKLLTGQTFNRCTVSVLVSQVGAFFKRLKPDYGFSVGPGA